MLRQIKQRLKMKYLRHVSEKDQKNSPVVQPEQWGLTVDGNSALRINAYTLRNIADIYGTPLHVVNEDVLERSFCSFRNAFREVYPHVELATSYKTNPIPGVIKKLHSFGSWAEVISDFELWLALKHTDPKKIILNGPAKTAKTLEVALKNQVRLINIDSVSELGDIGLFAKEANVRQPVGLRLTTSVGWSSQFGFSIKDGSANSALKALENYSPSEDSKGGIALEAVHLHLGTGIKDVGAYRKAITEVLDFLFEKKIPIKIYDFGGGFPVSTVRFYNEMDNHLMCNEFSPLQSPEPSPQISEYVEIVRNTVMQSKHWKWNLNISAPNEDPPTIIFEPGRAVTSKAQTLLLRVLRRKVGCGKPDTIILDGGKNVALPLSYEYHHILPTTGFNEVRYAQDLYGPLCHPDDVVRKNIMLPTLRKDDVITVMDAGAYFIPNQLNFSNPRAGVVMVTKAGIVGVLREHETYENMIINDCD